LPTAAFFLRMPFQPARQLIDAGCAVALASDYNPGSSPSGNMNLVVAMSCIQMKMLPEEAINAATINGAYAMEIEQMAGSIAIGKKANLVFTKPIPSLAYLPYAFGTNLVDKVMMNGQLIECVPNFSEGNDMNIINQITAQIESVEGVRLLNVDPGKATNRTVVTMVGEPEAVIEAAFRAIRKAGELIDMSKHKGEHPRMGATDVCPLDSHSQYQHGRNSSLPETGQAGRGRTTITGLPV
jgi:adenine deaminase